LTIYFNGFNQNLPFIHHTWRPLNAPIELVLAICAIGAQQCCEYALSTKLYQCARGIHFTRLRMECHNIGDGTAALLGVNAVGPACPESILPVFERTGASVNKAPTYHGMDAVRCTLLLLCYVSWSADMKLVQQAYMLYNLLAHILHDLGLDDHDQNVTTTSRTSNWEFAMQQESNRRTKLSALSFLVTASITYDFSPCLRNPRNELRLPCSSAEWEAKSAAQWQGACRRSSAPQMRFHEALWLLLCQEGPGVPFAPLPTSFGTYLLIHGLLHRIAIIRELTSALNGPSSILPPSEIKQLEYVQLKCVA
jgi:hypothetical protein